jgi:hypothetical protein
MGTFLGVHDMGTSLSEDEFKASWEAYKSACSKLGCTAQHVHYNAEKGRGFCLTEASSAEEVQKAHDEAGVAFVEILEVKTSE